MIIYSHRLTTWMYKIKSYRWGDVDKTYYIVLFNFKSFPLGLSRATIPFSRVHIHSTA